MAGQSLRIASCGSSYNLPGNQDKYNTLGDDEQDDLGEGNRDDDQDSSERIEGACHVNLEANKHFKYKTTQSNNGTPLEVLLAKSGLNI